MEIQKLKVSEICASPLNPRKTFDKEAIAELAENIRQQGLLQPITVRPCGGGVEKVESADYGETAYGQFNDMKSKHPDALLLFRCGDFYECYEDDADKAAKVLGITVTIKKVGRKSIKMSGFPFHSLDSYLPKLIRTGTRVAICDMLFDAKKYKTGPSDVRLNAKGETEEVKYEIVCGERRYRAVKLLGKETIDAIVRDMTDEEAFDAMITENLQRKDVDPIEECMAYNSLLERGQTTEDIAARMGKSLRYVQDRARLRGLIKQLHKPLTDGVIPLKGAINLAKCSAETQEKFYEEELKELDDGETYSASDIKDFIEDDFMLLERAGWIGEDGGEEWNTDGTPCKQCFKNTANHGCLFYEMKGDAKCTDRDCFDQKKMLYRQWWIEHSGTIVMKDEEYQPGKILLATEDVPAWRDESDKAATAKMEKWAEGKGYKVVNLKNLGGRCWYKDDDERLLQMMADGRVVKAIVLWGSFLSTREVAYFYSSPKVDTTGRDEKDVLIAKYKDLVEKKSRDFDEAAAKKVKQLDYGTKDGPIVAVESKILLLIILEQAGYSYLNENHIEWNVASRLKFLEEHPEKLSELRRRAIAEYCQRYNTGGAAALLLHELYPDEFKEIEQASEKAFDKKASKLTEQLADLGYNLDGTEIK